MNTPRVTGRGWAYIGAVLGGAVSIAANVAHSYVPPADLDPMPKDWTPHGGAVVSAVFWPVALLVAIEIIARVDWPTGNRWIAVRWLGLAPVAVVAAVVSYRHMSGLLAHYSEDSITAMFGPVAVDGLMVMATGALIATGQLRAAKTPDSGEVAVDPGPVTSPAPTPAENAPTKPAKTAARRTTKTRAKRPTKNPRRGRPSKATEIVAAATENPHLTVPEIAAQVGAAESTVRAHLPTKNPAVNGTPITTGAPT